MNIKEIRLHIEIKSPLKIQEIRNMKMFYFEPALHQKTPIDLLNPISKNRKTDFQSRQSNNNFLNYMGSYKENNKQSREKYKQCSKQCIEK